MRDTFAVCLALGLTGFAVAVESDPISLDLRGIRAELTSRERLRLVLETDPFPAMSGRPVVHQLLVAGDIPLPTLSGPSLAGSDTGGVVTLDIVVPAIPRSVLELPFEEVPIRWQGLDQGGIAVVEVVGTASFREGGNVSAVDGPVARGLASLRDHSVRLRGLAVAARLLVRFHNPMGFDVTVARFEYSVSVGGSSLVSGERSGFRLRPLQDTEVIIEAEIPLAGLAAGVTAAVIQGLPLRLDGVISLRTGVGDRSIPLSLTTAF